MVDIQEIFVEGRRKTRKKKIKGRERKKMPVGRVYNQRGLEISFPQNL